MDAARNLEGVKVAVIVSDGFEQVEFDGPVKALREAGAEITVLAEDDAHVRKIHGVNHFDPAEGTAGDRIIDGVSAEEFDGLLVPGGAISPDSMRQSEEHLRLVREFMTAGKPVAVICHGGWLLADAGVAEGRNLTSWPGIRRDLERAGAVWHDMEVVVDDNLVTSRMPDDIPAFSEAFIDKLAEARTGTHAEGMPSSRAV
ncbi:MAG TPA: type 1 glutamine amidotransferase domain-containing protein [Candidatus Thermoplasmatota archaeon]|nr:type 1 glutamine amidotransferase domain-containing protein [Candidatus Thermoplasmatota archaeon]